jgi:hypothetical protein
MAEVNFNLYLEVEYSSELNSSCVSISSKYFEAGISEQRNVS